MSERQFTILCTFIGFLFSLLGSFLIYKYQDKRNRRKDCYSNFYLSFCLLYNKIHQGRAFDFYDLTHEQQEKILDLLIENSRYADKALNDKIYILQCSRHNNFDNDDKSNIQSANQAYREIVEIISNKESKLRSKYK